MSAADDFFAAPSVHNVRLFAILFFAAVAIECFDDVASAAKYGAAGFNVAHFALFDVRRWASASVVEQWLAVAVASVRATLCYLALRIALGGASTAHYTLLWLLYSGCYFASQIDSYQHHYLVVLLLCILCCNVWSSVTRRRLLVAQMAFVYFWTALAKLDAGFLSGHTLRRTVGGPLAIALHRYVEPHVPLPPLFATLAVATVVAEFALAILLLRRRWWRYACLIGVPLHVGLELAGFLIANFGIIMISFYVLVVAVVPLYVSRLKHRVDVLSGGPLSGMILGLLALLLADFALSALVVLPPYATSTLRAVSALTVIATVLRDSPRVVSQLLRHLTAVGIVVLLAQLRNPTHDFYSQRAADLAVRQHIPAAIENYKICIDLEPSNVDNYMAIGLLSSQHNDAPTALKYLRGGLRRLPHAWQLAFALSDVYSTQQDSVNAQHFAREAKQLLQRDVAVQSCVAGTPRCDKLLALANVVRNNNQ